MKHIRGFNNLRFVIESGDKSSKIWMYVNNKKIGYSLVTIKDDIFDKWNIHDDVEVEMIENEKSLYIIGISMDDRRNGYGSKLVNHIEKFAIENGCSYITLSSITESIGFWKKVGYDVYSVSGYFSMYKKITQ